jgi:non-specific serine/threonine protein kinase
MVILHGLWWRFHFYLWGERAPSAQGDNLPTAGPAPKAVSISSRAREKTGRGRRTGLRHPQALEAAELRATLGETSHDGLLASTGKPCLLTLWMPCRDGVPVPSNEAIAANEADHRSTDGPATLQRVSVPALAFGPADAVDLLCGPGLPQQCAWDEAFVFWSKLAKLTLSLLARQQFVPDIEETAANKYAARWRPVVTDADEMVWLEKYAATMPPACRAISDAKEEERSPALLVDSFLCRTVDAIVRRSLLSDPFFRQILTRARKKTDAEFRWLRGLLAEDDRVRGRGEENAALLAQVRSWIGEVEEAEIDEPAARLQFTLLEPDQAPQSAEPSIVDPAEASGPHGAEAPWKILVELRSDQDERALDYSKTQIEPANGGSILGRRLLNRRRRLESELARAAQVFPPLQSTLGQGGTTSIELTTARAHAFLREWAPLLRTQGFRVVLPDWAAATEPQLGLQLWLRPSAAGGAPWDAAAPDDPSIGSLGLNVLLEFNWRVAIGDDSMSLEAFEGLAEMKAPLVRLHGRWVDIDWDAATRALRFTRGRPAGSITLAEALHLAGGMEDADSGLPIVGIRATSWLEQLLERAPDSAIRPLDQPETFRGTLRPYQRRGLEWLAFLDRLGIGGCLADDMGLGKTIQLIALLLHERGASAGTAAGGTTQGPSQAGAENAVGPTLLFAPMSVVGNWEREVARFGPSLRVLVHHGPDRLSGESLIHAATMHDLVITTYGLAHRDLQDLSRIAWYRIALDEAQKIKNPNARQSVAIRSFQSRHRVALTGTPVENHLSELWSIMETLNPGILGSASAFRARFAVPIERMGDQPRANRLRRLIRPFVLRRLKSDPKVECDLPEKMEMRVYCNLTAEQAAYYQRLVTEMLKEVDSATGIRRRGLILATLTRLKQVCNHPEQLLRSRGPLDGRSGKCERLVEMLEELLDEGDAALVFTQYREMGGLLERLLRDRLQTEVLFMHGGTPSKRRDEMILRFQDETSPTRIFLLSLKAGGFGLNLTRANHVFHFDRWWNPAVEEQATDRVHRIGQTRRVQVHKFVCIGTIEDRIDQLLAEKSAMAAQIVGSGEEWLTGLSTRELREYLNLSPQAVAEE